MTKRKIDYGSVLKYVEAKRVILTDDRGGGCSHSSCRLNRYAMQIGPPVQRGREGEGCARKQKNKLVGQPTLPLPPSQNKERQHFAFLALCACKVCTASATTVGTEGEEERLLYLLPPSSPLQSIFLPLLTYPRRQTGFQLGLLQQEECLG